MIQIGGTIVRAMREDQAYAMDQAIGRGDRAALFELLSVEPRLTGTPIPVVRDWGEEMWLGLHRAAEQGGTELVSRLLEAGASVDARTRFRTPMHGRETALMIAARCGHAEVTRLLLERQADPTLLDATHRSALTHAAANGHIELVRRIVDHGCPLDPIDDQQRTPLHWAIAGGHAEAALVLIEAGADVDHRCPKEPVGYTPLHRCASVGQVVDAVQRVLIESGADTALRDPRFGRSYDELSLADSDEA